MKIRHGSNGEVSFYCVGCKCLHTVDTRWHFNGNTEKPSLSPSILCTTGCYTPQHRQGDSCWCTFNAEEIEKGNPPTEFRCGRCHLYLEDGVLKYLSDSTHELAGKNVDLIDIPRD